MIKNLLFSATAFVALSMGANAQETISFEASEGFSIGDVTGQNGWVTNLAALPTDPDNPTINVVNTLSNDGDNSLYFEGTNLPYVDSEQNPYFIGAAAPAIEVSTNVFEISFDIYVTDIVPAAQYTSDINIQLESGESLASVVQFGYEGSIRIVENGAWETTVPYDIETWYTVKISYDFDSGTIEYFLDDTSFF